MAAQFAAATARGALTDLVTDCEHVAQGLRAVARGTADSLLQRPAGDLWAAFPRRLPRVRGCGRTSRNHRRMRREGATGRAMEPRMQRRAPRRRPGRLLRTCAGLGDGRWRGCVMPMACLRMSRFRPCGSRRSSASGVPGNACGARCSARPARSRHRRCRWRFCLASTCSASRPARSCRAPSRAAGPAAGGPPALGAGSCGGVPLRGRLR